MHFYVADSNSSSKKIKSGLEEVSEITAWLIKCLNSLPLISISHDKQNNVKCVYAIYNIIFQLIEKVKEGFKIINRDLLKN